MTASNKFASIKISISNALTLAEFIQEFRKSVLIDPNLENGLQQPQSSHSSGLGC